MREKQQWERAQRERDNSEFELNSSWVRCNRVSRKCYIFNGHNVLGQATCRRIFGKRTTLTLTPTALPSSTATRELRLHLLSLSALAANLANNPRPRDKPHTPLYTHTHTHIHTRTPPLAPCRRAYNVLFSKGAEGGRSKKRWVNKTFTPRAFCIFFTFTLVVVIVVLVVVAAQVYFWQCFMPCGQDTAAAAKQEAWQGGERGQLESVGPKMTK